MKEYCTSLGSHDEPEYWAYSNISKYLKFYNEKINPLRSRDTINFLGRMRSCRDEIHLILADLVNEQGEV